MEMVPGVRPALPENMRDYPTKNEIVAMKQVYPRAKNFLLCRNHQKILLTLLGAMAIVAFAPAAGAQRRCFAPSRPLITFYR